VALAHDQFDALHPSSDGNGRIGRLLMLLQLTSEGALRHPTLSISAWLEQRRDDSVTRVFIAPEVVEVLR